MRIEAIALHLPQSPKLPMVVLGAIAKQHAAEANDRASSLNS